MKVRSKVKGQRKIPTILAFAVLVGLWGVALSARISYLEGLAEVRSENGQWSAAEIGQEIAARSEIRLRGDGGLLELETDKGSLIHLAAEGWLSLETVAATSKSLRLVNGELILRAVPGSTWTIKLGTTTLQIAEPGIYRLTADRPARLLVHQGEAHLETLLERRRVGPDQGLVFDPVRGRISVIFYGSTPDTLDRWSQERASTEEPVALSSAFVGDVDVRVGATHSDSFTRFSFGAWSSVPGWVWFD